MALPSRPAPGGAGISPVSAVGWFDRCLGEEDPAEAYARLAGWMEGCGVNEVLGRACGRPGLRRFLVRFEVRGPRVRFEPPDTAPLVEGGGPPPAFDAPALEAALLRLRGRMRRPWTFDRGVLAVVRDGDGTLDISVRFDEDAAGVVLADLRMPVGPPHPLDHPAWVRAVAEWATRLGALRWLTPARAWSWDGSLVVDGGVLTAERLGVWRRGRFDWLLAEPAGDEPPLCTPSLEVSLAEASELAGLAAARRGCRAVFRGVAEHGETVFGGVW